MPIDASTPSAVRWSGFTARGRRRAIQSRTRASGTASRNFLLRGASVWEVSDIRELSLLTDG